MVYLRPAQPILNKGLYSYHIFKSIASINSDVWNECAGTENPFVHHSFLLELEKSGCVGKETGWIPMHLCLKLKNKIVACTPTYLKNHSQGEYVFDHGWAEAFIQNNRNYYPKLQVSIPFTPVTGPRLLVHPSAPKDTKGQLIDTLIKFTQSINISSLHITFCNKEELNLFESHGLLSRIGQQFHFKNKNYKNFNEFLSSLSSRKRKMIKKERNSVKKYGINIQCFLGTKASDSDWEEMYNFYIITSQKKWGRAYLNKTFFNNLRKTMADKILFIMAIRNNKKIAGAMNLIGKDTLFGRYWGCREEIPFLHFEVCYYRAIEEAIKLNLKTVEAGAQGPHKILRGYMPVATYSSHYIRDPMFRDAIKNFLEQEKKLITSEIKNIESSFTPFRKK